MTSEIAERAGTTLPEFMAISFAWTGACAIISTGVVAVHYLLGTGFARELLGLLVLVWVVFACVVAMVAVLSGGEPDGDSA